MVGQLVCRIGNLFPGFAEMIQSHLNMPQYGGLGINGCHLVGFLDFKFDDTCAPWTGPMTDEELAEQWP
jgi:hypothetical protein